MYSIVRTHYIVRKYYMVRKTMWWERTCLHGALLLDWCWKMTKGKRSLTVCTQTGYIGLLFFFMLTHKSTQNAHNCFRAYFFAAQSRDKMLHTVTYQQTNPWQNVSRQSILNTDIFRYDAKHTYVGPFTGDQCHNSSTRAPVSLAL